MNYEKAVQALREGKVIIYPTDTVYGIGADATNQDAVAKVYEMKQIPREQPISVLVADFKMLYEYAEISPEQKQILMKKLPGPHTFILKPKKKLHVSSGTVAFRLPKHDCTKIAKALGKPITTTVANVHGQVTYGNIHDLRKVFGDKVAEYVDGGKLNAVPSPITDLTTNKIVRK
jgi:L-threonylcarbamoyladenylate synthase